MAIAEECELCPDKDNPSQTTTLDNSFPVDFDVNSIFFEFIYLVGNFLKLPSFSHFNIVLINSLCRGLI